MERVSVLAKVGDTSGSLDSSRPLALQEQAPGVAAGSKAPRRCGGPSPPAAPRTPPHYLLESGAISVALALKMRPRAGRAQAARGPSSG